MEGDAPTEDDWQQETLLKSDTFGSVSLVRFHGKAAIRREIASASFWFAPISRYLFNRELRALRQVGDLKGVPQLLAARRNELFRSYVDGLSMHIARPAGDEAYFQAAKRLLRSFHRLGLTHNDLAKEQNWLVCTDGSPGFIDFQLAYHHPRRGKLFRIAAYEDLRHLLKHKRTYVPEALSARERRILARKSLAARIWRVTGKRLYVAVTRGIFNWSDGEGSGGRFETHGKALAARLESHAGVRRTVVCAYPNRRRGEGLYAFVEADGVDTEALTGWAAEALGPEGAPDIVQLVDELPRGADGAVRADLLQHIARNLVDPVERALEEAPEIAPVTRSVMAGRQNLSDRK